MQTEPQPHRPEPARLPSLRAGATIFRHTEIGLPAAAAEAVVGEAMRS